MTKSTPIESITLKLIDLAKQRIDVHLELHHNHLIYNLKFLAEEPEENTDVWGQVDNDFEFLYFKRFISGLKKQKNDLDRFWKIIVSVDGVVKDLTLYFKSKKDCDPVYEKLSAWLINSEEK